MTDQDGSLSWMAKYYPAFIGVVLCCCLAIGTVVAIVGFSYLANVPLKPLKGPGLLWGGASVGVAVFISHFLMVRGRLAATWVIAAVLLACLATALPSYFYQPPLGVFAVAVLSPLTGLLLLNSRRHREMRQHFLWLRRQR
ncbi:hypothetical protein RAM80_19915 [Pseudomonas sp. App30]|uniref:hypothetical protein n=1 Tax=Pseudomonas sp. App30 TaxID=3068990 RepID=UPI003A7F9768